MILKGFKENSNQKFIEKTLAKRIVTHSEGKIKSVGVLLNHSEFANYEAIEVLLKDLDISSNNSKTLTFLNAKEAKENSWDNTFTAKDFGWKGKLKTTTLQDFTKTSFDVLICYFLADDAELKQIAAMSKAKFKVGISNADERLFDLIIDVPIKNFDVFMTELKKYLTLLKKI